MSSRDRALPPSPTGPLGLLSGPDEEEGTTRLLQRSRPPQPSHGQPLHEQPPQEPPPPEQDTLPPHEPQGSRPPQEPQGSRPSQGSRPPRSPQVPQPPQGSRPPSGPQQPGARPSSASQPPQGPRPSPGSRPPQQPEPQQPSLAVPVAAPLWPRRAACRIGRRLGAGGFAEIYEAELDPEQGGPKVALKRLLPGLRQDPMRRRHLIREAQLMAQLAHPNIVSVLELVELDDEIAIAMELVAGISANHLLHRLAQRSQRLSLSAATHIMDGLLSALMYLESRPCEGHRPLVHADISLENVMITSAGGIKLVDFGIAGLDPSSPTDEEGVTSLHHVAGKRSYIPPEGPRAASLASDLYAAGVCFWELLAGWRFPVLPKGVTSRELGSLIAFAAADLPEGVWIALKLSLALDPAARLSSAARCRELLNTTRMPAPFSKEALGQVVGILTQGGSPPASQGASEVHDVVASLGERLHGAFCARRVLAYQPVPPDEVEAMGGHEFILRAESGPPGEPVPQVLLREALDHGFVDEDGMLLYRVRLPGQEAHVVVLQPDAGCVYDPLAQQILRGLLAPGGGRG